MKSQIIAVCLVIGALQGSGVAQDWSSWTTVNKDVQYRWLASVVNGSKECHVQLRDQKPEPAHTTVASVRIDYQSQDAESTRDVVTITDVKGENVGETTVHQCVSVGDLHVTDIVRR